MKTIWIILLFLAGFFIMALTSGCSTAGSTATPATNSVTIQLDVPAVKYVQ